MEEKLYWDEEEIMASIPTKRSAKKLVTSNKVAKKEGAAKANTKTAKKHIKQTKNDKANSKHNKNAKVSTVKGNEKGKKVVAKKEVLSKSSSANKKSKSSNKAKDPLKRQKAIPPAENKEHAHAYDDPDWEGNDDDNGSVASGVLEEDYCYVCGDSTLNADQWNNVVLCDVCDGEYHLKCVGLDKLPTDSFVCYKCVKEREQQKNVVFNVSNNNFPVSHT